MADPLQALASNNNDDDDDEGRELEELEKLEEEVNQMAQRILDYRATLPDQLKATLSSIFVSQRPAISTHLVDGSDPGPSTSDLNPDVGRPVESSKGALSADEDQENTQKIQLLKEKISSNASAMPTVLKRMKECMSRIDKLESCNGLMHPAFKRKRTT